MICDHTARSISYTPPNLVEELPKDIGLEINPHPDALLNYRIQPRPGGCVIEAHWNPHLTNAPLWIALKTCTGLQVRYPDPHKNPPLSFALIDEDAYCYCKGSTCDECAFMCKRGFILYAFFEKRGLMFCRLERVRSSR
ncbi:hypothetical protein HLV38_06780 [Berryella wangjianweii]|uniref:Uncharacterized protein n=1 Tax=Berryella wangjianweii TaxID=2734634 RepID=A0A6M8J5F1_9ACTN|nr:hypothetical protein [Berryella wangjianweii]QKF07843.1 hypothetical protein HLV38_06780 [Berryella wangjianweii]